MVGTHNELTQVMAGGGPLGRENDHRRAGDAGHAWQFEPGSGTEHVSYFGTVYGDLGGLGRVAGTIASRFRARRLAFGHA